MGDGKRGGDRGGDARENRGWGRDLEGVGAWGLGCGFPNTCLAKQLECVCPDSAG